MRDERVDQLHRLTGAPEAADHHRRAIRDAGDRGRGIRNRLVDHDDSSIGVTLAEHLARDAERGVRRGNAGVEAALQDHLADLVDGEPVAQRRAQVHRELLVVAERDQGAQHRDRARSAIEARARPDVAPRDARDEVLEVRREVGGAGDRTIDVGVREHLAAHRHPALVALAVGESGIAGHRRILPLSSSKKSRTARAVSAGRSAGGRCAAPSIRAARPSPDARGDLERLRLGSDGVVLAPQREHRGVRSRRAGRARRRRRAPRSTARSSRRRRPAARAAGDPTARAARSIESGREPALRRAR